MKKPFIIAVAGPVGAGKTTFSGILAKRLGAKHYAADEPFFYFVKHDPIATEQITGVPVGDMTSTEYLTKHLLKDTDTLYRYTVAAWEYVKQVFATELAKYPIVIVDFWAIDKEFYESADLRILIKSSDDEARLLKYQIRESESKRNTPAQCVLVTECAAKLVNALWGLQDILIINSYDGLDLFEQEAERIAKALQRH